MPMSLAGLLLLLAVPAPQTLELKGAVTTAGDRPVSGASVFIATARPRRGIGVL